MVEPRHAGPLWGESHRRPRTDPVGCPGEHCPWRAAVSPTWPCGRHVDHWAVQLLGHWESTQAAGPSCRGARTEVPSPGGHAAEPARPQQGDPLQSTEGSCASARGRKAHTRGREHEKNQRVGQQLSGQAAPTWPSHAPWATPVTPTSPRCQEVTASPRAGIPQEAQGSTHPGCRRSHPNPQDREHRLLGTRLRGNNPQDTWGQCGPVCATGRLPQGNMQTACPLPSQQ